MRQRRVRGGGAHAVATAPTSSGQGRPAAPAGGGRTATVLLVDDRPENLVALEAVLAPLGYELLMASGGTEALRLLLEMDVSAIVLDVQMPDMDGFETALLIKSREATRHIPILFLTAVGTSLEYELRGYEVGATDYIAKPFEPLVLQAKVRAAVGWSEELRALRRASEVFHEATAALAALPAGGRDPVPATAPVATTRLVDETFDASVSAPASARAAVEKALAPQRGDRVDAVVLLVSELITNAVVHAGTSARLVVDAGPAVVRVEVEDAAATTLDPEPTDVFGETGRGLQIVQRVADRYGWSQRSGAKAVWFEIDWTR